MELTSVTTSYSSLESKYNGFSGISCEVKIGGSKLVADKKLAISEMEVELTSGFEASGCRFTIISSYDWEKSEFDPAVKAIAVGDSIDVEIGYVKRENVFSGYVSNISYEFGNGGKGAEVHIEGMDIKGLFALRN